MGGSHSSLPKDLPGVADDDKFFGLENFGNTCYINSVVQALFCCKLFRDKFLQYVDALPDECEGADVLLALADLFTEVRGVLFTRVLLDRRLCLQMRVLRAEPCSHRSATQFAHLHVSALFTKRVDGHVTVHCQQRIC